MLIPLDLQRVRFKLELRLSLGFFFLHAEALSLYIIKCLQFSKEIQINFCVSYVVFVVLLCLKLNSVCLFKFPLQISSVFHFLEENSDISFLYATAAKFKNSFLYALQCKVQIWVWPSSSA